ncbi:MAG: hypothetical protein AUJ57_00145 [Zetaproteobacteria bacterium CG1_02_53_45]|nr:MAG: hypothetical protein AUJ57_00145 [Zetaproteobacteria bacterium CG1_02_53_45]
MLFGGKQFFFHRPERFDELPFPGESLLAGEAHHGKGESIVGKFEVRVLLSALINVISWLKMEPRDFLWRVGNHFSR